MASILAAIFTACALSYGIYHFVMWHLRRRRLYELASKFEGPPGLPIIGIAHTFIGNSEHLLNQIYKVSEMYRSPFRAWIGPYLGLFVADPEQIKAICLSAKTLGKSHAMEEFARSLVGEGLLTAPVPKWKKNRKMIQPTFNAKILESFVEIFVTQSKILTEIMKRHLDGPEFEIFELVSPCTLDIICETAMGVKIEEQTNEHSQYVEAVREAFAISLKRFTHFWLHPDFIFYRTKLGKDYLKYIKYLNDLVDNVIRMKEKESNERNDPSSTAENFDDEYDSTLREKTFLELLMKQTDNGVKLSSRALRDEVLAMILGGNDTTANTIPVAMLMLASHQDLQDKVYQELCEIYGNTDIEESPVTAKDLPRMKYLECVIKETMRLFPVIPYIVREVSEDLSVGEHTYPAGGTVLIGILNLHRNEKYWPDPLKFDPDRFLPEENAKRHPYAYMPFSGGPRNCIGHHYAMLSMKTVIATILRRFILKKDNIVPTKDLRFKYEVMMIPVDPITLRIERRTRN